VNRLLVPYLSEAIRLAGRKVASYEDIDNAMKLGALSYVDLRIGIRLALE